MEKNRGFLKALTSDKDTSHAWTIAAGFVVLLLVVGLFYFASRARLARYPPEYSGRIVEKWAGYNHTNEGSFPYFRLLLETDGGQRFTVGVDQQDYERLTVGMKIRKTSKGIELEPVSAIREHVSPSGVTS